MDKMLLKDTLELISEREPALYSRLFLMEKYPEWRPVEVLLPHNSYILGTAEKMERVIYVLVSSS